MDYRENEDENLRRELSRVANLNLTFRHVSAIVKNAERNNISNEESARDFANAVIEYERSRIPQPRTH